MKTGLKIIIPIIVAVAAIIIAVFAINFTSDNSVDINSLISTAQNYLNANNYEQAIAEFEKIIELDPKNVDAYIGLAQAYQDKGDIEKAIETLEKGIEATGDQRLKDLLDALLKPDEINAEVTEISSETTENSVSEQEEFKLADEVVSFFVPYGIEKYGDIYGDAISDIYYDDVHISINYDEYSKSIYYYLDRDVSYPNDHYGIDIYNSNNNWSIYCGALYNIDVPICPAFAIYGENNNLIYHNENNENNTYTVKKYLSEKDENYNEFYNYYYYDQDGILKEHISSTSMNNVIKGIYKVTYDSSGNEISQTLTYDDPSYDETRNYTYENGLLIKSVETCTNCTSTTEYKYDSSGNLIKELRNYTNNEYDYTFIQNDVTIYTYDSNNNLIKRENISDTNNGSHWGYTDQYTYDPHNNCIKEESYSYNENEPYYTVEYKYEYDNDGRPIKCEQYKDGEYSGSIKCSKYIRIDIPKEICDEIFGI